MNPITGIKLTKTLNSKKQPTIQALIITKKTKATATAPSGTSAGKHEAKSMPQPADILIKQAQEKLIPALIGIDVVDQKSIDETLIAVDGDNNFSVIGGSVATAISIACLKSAAKFHKKEVFEYLRPAEYLMPKLLGKCIGGGAHAKDSTSIQEFLSIPITSSAGIAVEVNKRVHALVGKKLNAKKLDFEGGWITDAGDEKALDVLAESISYVSSVSGVDIAMGLDMASSELYDGKEYVYKDKKLSAKEQLNYASELVEKYGLYYIEDAFDEEDFKSFSKLTKSHKDVLVCGDDLFTTNASRLKKGIKEKACNSIIIKPNQIGTVTQTEETIKLAKKHAYLPVLSHRSGETKDPVLADLAVGWQIPFLKIGIRGAERTAKTNRLQEIEKKVKK